MKNAAILNTIFKIAAFCLRYSSHVGRLFKKLFLGFGLSAVLLAGLSACSAKLTSPIAPSEPLSDGVPITGVNNPLNYFSDVLFLSDQGGQSQYSMTAVHECFQITDVSSLLGRFVAISTAAVNDPSGAQHYLWYYEGVQFLSADGRKDRTQSTAFGHYAFSNRESQANQTGNLFESFSVQSTTNGTMPYNGSGTGQPSEMDMIIKWTADGYELKLGSSNSVRVWDPAALNYLGLASEVQFALQCDSAPR
jgi:hypothetical protein